MKSLPSFALVIDHNTDRETAAVKGLMATRKEKSANILDKL